VESALQLAVQSVPALPVRGRAVGLAVQQARLAHELGVNVTLLGDGPSLSSSTLARANSASRWCCNATRIERMRRTSVLSRRCSSTTMKSYRSCRVARSAPASDNTSRPNHWLDVRTSWASERGARGHRADPADATKAQPWLNIGSAGWLNIQSAPGADIGFADSYSLSQRRECVHPPIMEP